MDTTTQPPHYTITRAGLRRNKYRVRLVGANGEIIAWTQPYTDIHTALDACTLINPTYLATYGGRRIIL
jgi:uncharacterized protein YegP (UPF0339 family)